MGNPASDAPEKEGITDLMGRKAFYQAVLRQAAAERAAGTYGLHCPVYFNITNFKSYNSLHGYEAGDKILMHMAKLLHEVFAGELMAHLAADAFVVLALEADVVEKVEYVCRQMNLLIRNSSIEVKAGLRFYRSSEADSLIVTAFDQAKIACDLVKKDATRSWAAYDEAMGQRLNLRNYIIENVDRAVERGDIKVYLQPVVRTLTGKPCSAEALMRWVDPQHGMLAPNVVIPVLEEAGLIHKVDAFVIRQVVRFLHEQRANDLPLLPVSINLSPLDFTLMDPLDVLESAMAAYSLPHEYIHIEITESALVRDKGMLLAAIERFHAAGYEVWLDDFGSGYSSLNVLKDYPFDLLKIDMVFLRSFSKKSQAIIASIVHMAKEIGIPTLAEGVETEMQVSFLADIGCERIQGYYYGRPMTYESYRSYCTEPGRSVETQDERQFFRQIGQLDWRVKERERRTNALMHDLYQIFQHVLFLDLHHDRCGLLAGSCDAMDGMRVAEDIDGFFRSYARALIHPDDRQQFLSQMNVAAMEKRTTSVQKDLASMYFRIRQIDGTYDWARFDIVMTYVDEQTEFLMSVQRLPAYLSLEKVIRDMERRSIWNEDMERKRGKTHEAE